jgi:excisionase family DNA binding protein
MEADLVALMTIAETTTALRVCRRSVDRLLKEGQLDSVRIGSRRFIPLASVERLATPRPKEGNDNGR